MYSLVKKVANKTKLMVDFPLIFFSLAHRGTFLDILRHTRPLLMWYIAIYSAQIVPDYGICYVIAVIFSSRTLESEYYVILIA